jgi:hypothetical protein
MSTQRDTINGIRFIACGYADFAWDDDEGWVSINSDYIRNGARACGGIRWQVDVWRTEDLALINDHKDWLQGRD